MLYRDTHASLRSLYAIAVTQGGYFTAKQAADAGYGYPHLAYHLRVGNFERVGHGLYRLPTIPSAEHDDFIRLSLWSRNRRDVPQAVVSHESALLIHQLSDALPHQIYLTVPPTFRKPALAGCVFHKSQLARRDIEHREGFAVTSPLRTLIDVAHEPNVPREHVTKAISQAVERGLVPASAVHKLVKRMSGRTFRQALSLAS